MEANGINPRTAIVSHFIERMVIAFQLRVVRK